MPLEKNSRRRCRYLQHKYSPPAIKITATAESTVLNMITRFLLPATPSSPPGEVSLVTASVVVGTAEAGISVDIISATSVSGYEEAMEEEKGEVVEIDVKVKSVSEGTAPVVIGASSGPVEVDGTGAGIVSMVVMGYVRLWCGNQGGPLHGCCRGSTADTSRSHVTG